MTDAHSTRTTIMVITHNYGRYLPTAVVSAVTQTRRPQVVIMDDGSTDDTEEVAGALVARYPELRYHRTPQSQGLAATRNAAADMVQTEWVVYLDADDWLDPHFVERGERWLERHPGCDVLTTDMAVLRPDRAPVHVRARVPRSWRGLLRKNTVFQTSFVRRSMVQALSGYDPTFAYEDWEFWIRALKAGNFIARLPGVHVFRREHGSNYGALANRAEAIRAVRERHPVPSLWDKFRLGKGALFRR
jgi:glycosyltransferase involved in cell wall biosynthesis